MRHLIIEEPFSESAIWSRRLAIFATAVVATGLVLARLGLDAPAVLAVVGSAIVLACLAVLCAGVATVEIWQTGRKGVGLLLGGAVLAVLLLAYPAYLAVQAVRLPVLNDISTDTDDPPAYSLSRKALAARHGWVPPSIPEASRQAQAAAYPDVEPIYLDLDGDEAYQTVLSAAAARHWKVIELGAARRAARLRPCRCHCAWPHPWLRRRYYDPYLAFGRRDAGRCPFRFAHRTA